MGNWKTHIETEELAFRRKVSATVKSSLSSDADVHPILQLQQIIGNQAVQGFVQEVLQSSWFADNQRLQQAFNNNPPLMRGERGEAVAILQQVLLSLGFPMPRSTQNGQQPPDGIFGSETFETLQNFQNQCGLQADGRAGRKTLGALDLLFLGSTPGLFVTPKTIEEVIINLANRERKGHLLFASLALSALETAVRQNVSKSVLRIQFYPVVNALAWWLYAAPEDSDYLDKIVKAKDLINKNLGLNAKINYGPDVTCSNNPRWWAYAKAGTSVQCCNKFFTTHQSCQSEILTHEFFHLIGLKHVGTTHNTAEALSDVHTMTQFVFDIAMLGPACK